MRLRALLLFVLIVATFALMPGCATVAPNPAIVVWDTPDPWWQAVQHAERISGMAYRAIGESMLPFIVENDFLVADFAAKWADIRPGSIVVYDPNWADASIPLVSHMAVERTGAGWVMTGVNNQHSESGARALMEADYRAIVVQIYTSRTKP